MLDLLAGLVVHMKGSFPGFRVDLTCLVPVFPSRGQLGIFIQSECCAWATGEGVPMNEVTFAPVVVDFELKLRKGLGSARIEQRQQTSRPIVSIPQQLFRTFA